MGSPLQSRLAPAFGALLLFVWVVGAPRLQAEPFASPPRIDFTATLGIEIEAMVKKGTNAQALREQLREILIELGATEIEFDAAHRHWYESLITAGRYVGLSDRRIYKTSFVLNGRRHVFGLLNEVVTVSRGHNGIEIISPIIHDYDEFSLFQKIVASLIARAELKPAPVHGGTHFHLGVEDLTAAELSLFGRVMGRFENKLMEIFSSSIRRRHFIRTQSPAVQKALGELAEGAEIERLVQVSGKNEAVSYQSYARLGTAETRLANSTFNVLIHSLMADLLMKAKEAVKKDPRAVEALLSAELDDAHFFDAFTKTFEISLGTRHDEVRLLTHAELSEGLKLRYPWLSAERRIKIMAFLSPFIAFGCYELGAMALEFLK